MLNEGLHISDVDGVILLRLTESPIIFYQQIGRCIQTNPNQTPIIFDFVNNFRNIRAQDFLHDLQIAKNVENSLRKNYQLNPSDVQFSITDTTLEIREILAEIENRIGGWEIQFQLLKLFSEEHGHCRVPQKYTANPRLGHWVSNQRANKVNLSPKQIQQLNSLDFDWDPRLTDWELGFKSLVAFSNENGHCNVPPKEDKYSGLRNWIFSQRENKDNLPPAFIKRLESIGFDWDPINTQWEQNYTELTKFSKQNGHCLVPYDYPQNKSLGLWVQYQRNNKRRLTPERLELLKKINFDWNRRASMWDQRYEELQLFKKEHGSCDVPTNYPKNKKLALWVVVQRSQKDKLTNERFELLKKIGFNFDPFLAKWEVNFKDLEQYQKENGHCNVPIRYAPNKKLASWVSIQREKKDKLSADQIQRLNTLGFVWDPFEEMWNVQFKALLEFKAEEGHYNVPQGYSKNRKLGSWVSFQRNHRDKITPERMKKLKKIRFFKD